MISEEASRAVDSIDRAIHEGRELEKILLRTRKHIISIQAWQMMRG